MAVKLGVFGKLYRNTGSYGSPTWTEVANVGAVNVEMAYDEADSTMRDDAGVKTAEPTLLGLGITFDMLWDTADTNLIAIWDAFAGRTAIEFAVVDGAIATAGTRGWRMSCKIFGLPKSEELADLQKVSITAKPCKATNPPSRINVSA